MILFGWPGSLGSGEMIIHYRAISSKTNKNRRAIFLNDHCLPVPGFETVHQMD
jgi:hypothetical protein